MTFISNFKISNIQVPRVPFRQSVSTGYSTAPPSYNYTDTYTSAPNGVEYFDAAKIKQIAEANPRITEILNKYNIPLKINMKILDDLRNGHLKETRILSAKIYSNLPQELKNGTKMETVQLAAMLHDYGKILIPEEILNKKDRLTEKEREIIQLHSELGYELLKSQGVNEDVLNLVKYHHQTPDGNGYPELSSDYQYSVAADIIKAADQYTAIREERPYKRAMSKTEALDIIRKDTSPVIYDIIEKNTQ